jgi:predicted DNA-binding antitoxin AbrB/MazE fold protein
VKRLYHVDGTIRREVSAMTIDVDAVYEDGVLKPERPLALKEKARVHVTIEARAEQALPAKDDDDPTGWKAIEALRGIVKDAPLDMAENHDKYLYGNPRK